MSSMRMILHVLKKKWNILFSELGWFLFNLLNIKLYWFVENLEKFKINIV